MWFDSWNDVLRIVLVGALAYGILVLLLRLSGKRTLAKLNAFDFVITIALGSTLATILLDSRTSLADGLVAIWVLVFLQLVVATLTARLPRLRGVFTTAPAVLLLHGQAQPENMRRNRISTEELRQAVRAAGAGDLAAISAVVLETDGTMSVIPSSTAGDLSAVPGQELGGSSGGSGTVVGA